MANSAAMEPYGDTVYVIKHAHLADLAVAHKLSEQEQYDDGEQACKKNMRDNVHGASSFAFMFPHGGPAADAAFPQYTPWHFALLPAAFLHGMAIVCLV